MHTRHIVVERYDPQWKDDFKQIEKEIVAAVGGMIISVEHIGSTSVEGLSAKPIIDIDVVIKDGAVLRQVISALSSIGYIHEGDLGIVGREAFKYSDKPHLKTHHLYVCVQDCEELHRHITFRNYLRTHPDAVAEYSRVKEEAASLFPYSIERYMRHKASCIEDIYKMCGL